MENRIKLMPLEYKVKPTLIGQIHKCQEEDKEFIKAILKADINNAVEEFYDKITSSLNALRLIGIPLETILEGEKKHYEKLKNRGWNFEVSYGIKEE